jgi:hypothetical protein
VSAIPTTHVNTSPYGKRSYVYLEEERGKNTPTINYSPSRYNYSQDIREAHRNENG